jgi:hypothetical protein
MLKTEEYLSETADRCIRLARAGREIADSLEALSNDFMAKAIEIDTTQQKKNQKKLPLAHHGSGLCRCTWTISK